MVSQAEVWASSCPPPISCARSHSKAQHNGSLQCCTPHAAEIKDARLPDRGTMAIAQETVSTKTCNPFFLTLLQVYQLWQPELLALPCCLHRLGLWGLLQCAAPSTDAPSTAAPDVDICLGERGCQVICTGHPQALRRGRSVQAHKARAQPGGFTCIVDSILHRTDLASEVVLLTGARNDAGTVTPPMRCTTVGATRHQATTA